MIGATTPLVTVFLDRLIRQKHHGTLVYVAMVPLSLGCILCVKGEINFHWVGFLSLIIATVMRGLKSVLGGLLLTGMVERVWLCECHARSHTLLSVCVSGSDQLDSMTLLFLMSCVSGVLLSVLALFVEAPFIYSEPFNDQAWLFVVLSSFVSFFLNLVRPT